eukprot:gene54592-59527_t
MLRFVSYQRNIHHVPIADVVPYCCPDGPLYGVYDHAALIV